MVTVMVRAVAWVRVTVARNGSAQPVLFSMYRSRRRVYGIVIQSNPIRIVSETTRDLLRPREVRDYMIVTSDTAAGTNRGRRGARSNVRMRFIS